MLTNVEAFWLQWQAQEGEGEAAAAARAWLTAMSAADGANAGAGEDTAAVEQFREQGLTHWPAPTLADLMERAALADPQSPSVATTAELLFEATKPLHRLRPAARARLALAARLQHLAGRTPGATAAALEARPPAELSRREHAALVALLRAGARTVIRPTPPQPTDHDTQVLAALLLLAGALADDAEQAARLESATLTAEALVLRVRGLGAPATAQRVRQCRRRVKLALATGLRVTVAPPTLAEVQALLNEPVTPQTTTGRGVQRGVAGALTRWQAALERALTGDDATLIEAERETAYMRQVLAVFRPGLKRKATQRLRERLGEVQARLRAASSGRAVAADAHGYAAKLPAEAAAQIRPLLEALDQWGQKAFGEAAAWLQSAQAAELCEDLLALVGKPPVRHGPETPLRHSTPALLKAVVEAIGERQKVFEVGDGRTQRRLCEGLLRGQAAIAVLGGAEVFEEAGAALAADWQTVETRVEGMRHLAAVDEAVGQFLDEWALRQAKRKAPQLSGVDAVLAYRHKRRTERQALRKGLAAAWRPVQGRALAARLKKILAAFADQK